MKSEIIHLVQEKSIKVINLCSGTDILTILYTQGLSFVAHIYKFHKTTSKSTILLFTQFRGVKKVSKNNT
jgi:hypothetical protein